MRNGDLFGLQLKHEATCLLEVQGTHDIIFKQNLFISVILKGLDSTKTR